MLWARRAYPALRTRYQRGVHADSPALWRDTTGLYLRLLCSGIVQSLYPPLAIAAQLHLLWNTLIITPAVLEGGIDLAQLGFGQYTIANPPSPISLGIAVDSLDLQVLSTSLHRSTPPAGFVVLICREQLSGTP